VNHDFILILKIRSGIPIKMKIPLFIFNIAI
jgi:hypothetical protein